MFKTSYLDIIYNTYKLTASTSFFEKHYFKFEIKALFYNRNSVFRNAKITIQKLQY